MARTLFDFIKDLTELKTPIKEIDESDWKVYSVYMVNRFLSMNTDLLPIVAEVQHLLKNPKHHYIFFHAVLPQRKYYLKYVSGKGDKQAEKHKELIQLIADYFKVSTYEANDYLTRILENNIDGSLLLHDFVKMYGYTDQEINKKFKI
jgi:hypothetical protein